MKVIKNETTILFDIDETLIFHKEWHPGKADVPVDRIAVYDHRIQRTLEVKLNEENIALLKQSKARGRCVIVWSNAGYEWATIVIKKLGLTDHVDYVLTKPGCYVDDLDANQFMHRVYLGGSEDGK